MAKSACQLPDKLMVAAIDFGTTFSGYAFGFRNDYVTDPLQISGNQWTTGSQPGVSLKTPTCILFDPNERFDCFGTAAEDKYTQLALDNKHEDWFYFRRFKMVLYNNQTIPRDLEIEDDKGQKMSAMTVFSESIRFLREHMLRACSSRMIDIGEDEMLWVLTVPAIWTDSAKQFMREAAEKAGIMADQLKIALEPEAASIYCKHLPVNKITGCGGKGSLNVFSPGTKYLVLDCGGGTIDITVQQVQPDVRGTLMELHKANGGNWGGTTVDSAFEEFLGDVVSQGVINRFKHEHRADYVDLCRDFEIKKRTITPELDQKVTFKIPIAVNELYQEMKGKTLRDSVSSNSKYGNKLAWIGDKLRVDADIAKALFETTNKYIVEHVEKIFSEPSCEDTNIILMVGGFSESPMLRRAIEDKFGGKRIIIPQEAGLSVLKGAVLFGFDSSVIKSRICKYTYGISTLCKFRNGVDPPEKQVEIEGEILCEDRFSKHAEVGQSVEVGEATEERIYHPAYPTQTKVRLAVYVTEEVDPTYTTDRGCTYLGELTVDMPDITGGLKREVGVRLIFGGTELSVEAVIKKKRRGKEMSGVKTYHDHDITEEKTRATFDFLNHQM